MATLSFRSLGLTLGLACAALGASIQSANATAIGVDTWYEFGFGDQGTALTSGSGTVLATNPPDGNPVVQVGDAPWTITTTGTVQLTVLDLFLSVDQFEIFDNATSLGVTSAPVAGGDCGSDITCALNDLRFSRADFILGAGSHSLTGTHLQGIPGAGIFQISAVPEPATLALLAIGLAGFGLSRRKRAIASA